MGQRLATPTKSCPSCRFTSKIHKCCSKQLSFAVICHAAIGNKHYTIFIFINEWKFLYKKMFSICSRTELSMMWLDIWALREKVFLKEWSGNHLYQHSKESRSQKGKGISICHRLWQGIRTPPKVWDIGLGWQSSALASHRNQLENSTKCSCLGPTCRVGDVSS